MKSKFLQDLIKRVSMTLLLAVILIFLITFSNILVIRYVIFACVAALGMVAIWEYGKLAKNKGYSISSKVIILGAAIEIFSFFLASLYTQLHQLPLIVFFFWILVIFAKHFKKIENSIAEVSISSFGLLYISVPLGMIFPILFSSSFLEEGKWWTAYLLIVTKISDIGAYFGGKFLGKNKLAVSISPQKTKEGAFSGFLLSVLASVGFSLIGPYLPGGFFLDIYEALFLGALLGIIGQLGDLCESLFKRDAKSKDSNRLPGLGGTLDMLDSLLFTIPIVYFFLHLG